MSFHVSMDFVEIDQKFYNLSFIILKNSNSSNIWSHFFHRVHWDNDVEVPKNFYILDLGPNGRHFFHPCAPFHLGEDDCNSWLTWSTVRPNNGEGDEIKMLKFRGDPEEILGNPEIRTGISAHLQHSLWADQLSSTQQPALGNLSRMEHLVRQTINSQLRSIPNTVANKVRFELREHGRERRKPRSRSPEKRIARGCIERPLDVARVLRALWDDLIAEDDGLVESLAGSGIYVKARGHENDNLLGSPLLEQIQK